MDMPATRLVLDNVRPYSLFATAYEIFTATTRAQREALHAVAHGRGTAEQVRTVASLDHGNLLRADTAANSKGWSTVFSALGNEVLNRLYTDSTPPSDAPKF